MVGTISWLSQFRRSKTNSDHLNHSRWIIQNEKPETLGILAFDIAKTISRLISLYKSLCNDQITLLKEYIIRGKGVRYLTSTDERFLLTLACAEHLEDLDKAASTVARASLKCSDNNLVRFEHLYNDLKNGYVDMDKFIYGSKDMEKTINKMEKFTSLTTDLYDELESLSELEASERKLNEWRKNNNSPNMSYDLFDQKIAAQRKIVRQLKDASLWNQSHDKVVTLMVKIVCVLYARICTIFGPYVPILPEKSNKHEYHKAHRRNLSHQEIMTHTLFDIPSPKTSMSGPISGAHARQRVAPVRKFLSGDTNSFELRLGLRYPHTTPTNNKVFQAASPSTVGGAGLAPRYANVILLVDRYLKSESPIDDNSRRSLYSLLPTRLKSYIRSKLRAPWRETDVDSVSGNALAQGWREAIVGILEWLVPVAQDTLTWQAERNMEKQRFDTKPTVLLLQTLHYADLEKTEFAIAEVLSGLSCICWYQNRRLCTSDDIF